MKYLFPAVFILCVGCVSLTTRSVNIYELDGGPAVKANFVDYGSGGYGKITFIGADGEIFKGEYNNVDDAAGVGSYGWALERGFALYQPGKLMKSAQMTGNKGTTIDMVYSFDTKTKHGSGVGKDNKNRKYKIEF
jgi:hypothetical protein